MITSLGEERELVDVLHVHLFLYCPSSFLLVSGLVAACDNDIPWKFLLIFIIFIGRDSDIFIFLFTCQ